MARTRYRSRAAVLVALALWAAGCGEQVECAPGTHAESTACVATCGDGTEADPRTGACVAVCLPGTHRDSASGGCLPDDLRCVSGEVWDGATQTCLDVESLCAEGTSWVSSERRCVDDETLRVPEQLEGDGYNDYAGVDSTCEPLVLPEVGESRSFGGSIATPEASWSTVFPDNDCWAFEVDGPTLLRVRADGIGGAAAAFNLVRVGLWETHVDRFGMGTTSDAVERDVFIPEAGTYALVMSDAMNFLEGAPWHGGGGFGYYAEVETLPLPAPTPITLEGGRGSSAGQWALVPPEDGTSIGFYEVTLPRASLFGFDVKVGDYTVLPVLVAVGPDGRATEAPWNGLPTLRGMGTDGKVLLAVDFERWAALHDVPYTLEIEARELPMLDGDSGAFTFGQPAWSRGSDQPFHYFGFDVDQGDVVTVHFGSSTGFTCVFVWNERFDVLAGDRQCFVADVSQPETEVTFEARESGIHVVQVFDWAGSNVFQDTLLSTPAHDVDLSVRIERQTPEDLGRLETPFSGSVTVTDQAWERFFTMEPEPGDAFRFRLKGEEAFEPFFVSYYLAALVSALNVSWYPEDPSDFAYRSKDGARLLFGVSDTNGAAGTFDLTAERFVPIEVGPISGGSPAILDASIAAGEKVEYFQAGAVVPGRLTLTATPPADLDLSLVPLDESLRPLSVLERDDAGSGGAESFVYDVPAAPSYFSLRTADGQPVAADAAVSVQASLVPFTTEIEPNDTHEQAQHLDLPARVSAEGGTTKDDDWYRFDVDAPAVVDIVTGKVGWGGYSQTLLTLFDAEGRRIATGKSVDHFDQLRGVSLAEAGTYYLLVLGQGGQPPRYFLEVRHAAQ